MAAILARARLWSRLGSSATGRSWVATAWCERAASWCSAPSSRTTWRSPAVWARSWGGSLDDRNSHPGRCVANTSGHWYAFGKAMAQLPSDPSDGRKPIVRATVVDGPEPYAVHIRTGHHEFAAD